MEESLTNRQISFIIFSLTVGYNVINVPNIAAEAAGTGAPIPLFISTAVYVLFTYIITYIGYNNENKTLYYYSKELVGKTAAVIILIIYILYFISAFTLITRLYAETVHVNVLPKTPIWAICLLIYIVLFYAVTKKLRVIARISELYISTAIIGFIFIHILMFTQGKLIYLRPLFNFEEIISYIQASFKLILPFLGVEILTIIPINRTINAKIFKYTTLMAVFIGIFYIFIVESTMSVAGVDDIINYKASIFKVLKGIDIPILEFLRRLDGIYIFFWTLNFYCAICMWAYGSVYFISILLSKISIKKITIFILLLSYTAAITLKSVNTVVNILNYVGYLGIITLAVIPLFLLIMTKVKKNDKQAS